MKSINQPISGLLALLLLLFVAASCEDPTHEICEPEVASSVTLNFPLDPGHTYDSGQVVLWKEGSEEQVIEALTLEADSAYAVFDTLPFGDWFVEARLFFPDTELDSTFSFTTTTVDWGKAYLVIYNGGTVSLNGPGQIGSMNWMEAYYQHREIMNFQAIRPTDPCLFEETTLYLNGQHVDRVRLLTISAKQTQFPIHPDTNFVMLAQADWVSPSIDRAQIEFGTFEFLPSPSWAVTIDDYNQMSDFCDITFFTWIGHIIDVIPDTTAVVVPYETITSFYTLWTEQ